MPRVDYKSIFKIFLIFMKYSFNLLLFHSMSKKSLSLSCFTKYTKKDFPKTKIHAQHTHTQIKIQL